MSATGTENKKGTRWIVSVICDEFCEVDSSGTFRSGINLANADPFMLNMQIAAQRGYAIARSGQLIDTLKRLQGVPSLPGSGAPMST